MLALYLWLFFRAGLIIRRSRSTYGAFLAFGLAMGLVLQAFVNMAVAVGLVPVTGQTLPLVSMGGSSIFFTSMATGMILSVSWGSTEVPGETVPGEVPGETMRVETVRGGTVRGGKGKVPGEEKTDNKDGNSKVEFEVNE